MPAVQRSSDGPSTDVGEASTSSRAARKPRPKSMQHHHPYRIELLDVTPVSISLLWSTRPPPLSAIPLEIINTQLRKRIKNRVSSGGSGSSSPAHGVAKASAVSPSPPTATVSLAKSRSGFKNSSHSPDRSTTQTKSTTTQPDTHISKLTEGLVATRSRNRKVTKIRLRAPPSVAPKSSSNGAVPPDSAQSQHDDDNWPSDDGATAVEDEPGTGSEASDSGYEGEAHPHNNLVNVFEDKVSIAVNGQDWPHVLLGERRSHEAIVVIFALEPESDYDIQFMVKAGLEGTEIARASLRTRADRDHPTDTSPTASKAQGSSTTRTVSPSPLSRTPVSAPEVVSTSTETPPQRRAVLQAELDASEALKVSLLAEIKKARKEASKAEAGLKHEIDAIKRGMDRMSATDHRNRQKVLALQELIKQTTVHVQDIHQEAEQAEQSQPEWEAKVAGVDTDLEQLRIKVEADEATAQASWDQDEAAIAALEKELKSLETAARSLETERDEMQQQKLAPLHTELEKVKQETKDTLNKPYPVSRRGAPPSRGGFQRHVSNPSQTLPIQPLQKGKGSQNGRGGRTGYFGNRAVSGPAAAPFGGPVGQPTGFPGPARTGFMQNLGRGFRGGFHRSDMAPVGAGYPEPDGIPPSDAAIGYMGMQDPTLGGMPSYAGPFGGSENLYGMPYQQETEPQHFPSGVSEVSQDDLYDPTLGFDPYDPSPDARRRSSLPMPQISNQLQPFALAPANGTTLNPANPEFVPSGGSNHTSPVMSRGDVGPGATAAPASLPSMVAVSTQSPPAGTSSLEHSPTSSSRFAFPLARHQPASGSTGRSSVPPGSTIPGPNNVLSPTLGNELGLPSASASSPSLYPIGTTGAASPFARHSPLIPQGAHTNSATSPLVFSSNSPRFGHGQLRSSDDSANNSAFAKFGPLDYDPSMDGFGPASGLIGTGAGAGPGFGTNSSMSSYSSSAMPSIFSSNDTWSAPGAPTMPSLGSGSSIGSGPVTTSAAWSAPSPPLGTSASGGDIWSSSGLGGPSQLRSMPLNDSSASAPGFGSLHLGLDAGFGGFGNPRSGMRPVGHSSSGSSNSHHMHSAPTVTSPNMAVKSPPISTASTQAVSAEQTASPEAASSTRTEDTPAR